MRTVKSRPLAFVMNSCYNGGWQDVNTMPKILLFEDDEQLAGFLMRFLNSEGYMQTAGKKVSSSLF